MKNLQKGSVRVVLIAVALIILAAFAYVFIKYAPDIPTFNQHI